MTHSGQGGSPEATPPEGDMNETDHAQALGALLMPHIENYAERAGLTDEEAARLSLISIARHLGAKDSYMKPKQVAKLFGVSPKTISRYADEGRLPCIVTLGGHRRFPREAILNVLVASAHDTELPEPSEDS